MHWSASHRWKEICYGEKSWNNWSQYFCTWTTRCGVVSPKEKAQRKIEIWLYMVWSWPNLVSRLNWVKRDEKLHFSVKGRKTSWSCWRFVRFVPKLPKKSAEVSLNLSPKQLFYCRCRIICVASIFFPPTETKVKTCCKVSVRCETWESALVSWI